jgi:hypothetical protein
LATAGQYLDLGEANDLTTLVQGQVVDQALDEQLLIGIKRKTLDQEPEGEVAPAHNP